MKKRAVLLILALFFVNCVHSVKFPNSLVNDKVKDIYYASVSITDATGRVHGAGTILKNKSGQKMLVLTAAHVVVGIAETGSKLIAVSLAYDDKIKVMNVKKIDVVSDLALLEGTNDERFDGPYAAVSNGTPKIGDSVTVIGAPMGDERTVTTGIISNFYSELDKTFYRVSAPVYYGNSGGAAFDKNNELIGVAHAIQALALYIAIPGASFFVDLPSIKKFLQ
jgi:S1-C subfamily serine protease